ncbi:MAG: PEGA domain-containing protein [Bryobacteraceae bacterium]
MLSASVNKIHVWLIAGSLLACLFVAGPVFSQNKVLGEIEFKGATKVAKTSGVWIDGQYVWYLNELKGSKKIMLLPGEHEVSVRQAGYNDFTKKVIVEPRLILTVPVKMEKTSGTIYPKETAELKMDVHPDRAAVFVDDKFLGHAGELGVAFHSMLISPGKHRIKVELPGYQTFETDVKLAVGQKSVVKTDLVEGSISQADTLIKEPHDQDDEK